MQRRGLRGNHCTRIMPPDALELSGTQTSSTNFSLTLTLARPLQPTLLAWSANDETSLKQMISGYSKWFGEVEAGFQGVDITHLAHTLLQRRSLLQWRSFAIAQPSDPLESLAVSRPIQARAVSELSLAFVFTGTLLRGPKCRLSPRVYLRRPVGTT
jgi:hypothetical protein